MKHISPSRLAYVEACPRFTPAETSGAAADAGTCYHEIMEHLATVPVDGWDGYIAGLQVAPDTRGLVEASADRIRGYFSMGLDVKPNHRLSISPDGPTPREPGLYPECEVETWPGKKGRIDLLVVPAQGVGIICDYKSSRNEADFELQLGGYAAALRRLCGPWTQLTGTIIAPRLDELEDYVWDDANVVALSERISRIEELADNPFTAGRCGGHCAYCKWCGHCPHQARELQALAPEESGAAQLAVRVLYSPETPEERSHRRDFIAWCEAFVKAAKEDDKAYFNADPDAGLPGYKIVRSRGRRTLDKSRAGELYAKLKSELALDDTTLLSASVPNKDALVEVLALTLGETKTEASRIYDRTVDEFMQEGAPVTSLRRLAHR